MKDEGKCVVLISHKINELFAVADKVTILRKGKFIEELDMKAVTPTSLPRIWWAILRSSP